MNVAELALKVRCPFCGARRGKPCRTRSSLVEREEPHKERVELARNGGFRRGAGLRRGSRLEAKTRVKASNPERRKKAYARNFGDRADAVRKMACLVGGRGEDPAPCQGDVVAAHVIARGMGGAKGDRRSLVPLCWAHHNEAGERGTTQRASFEARYEVDLLVESDRIAAELDDEGLE